MRKRIPPLVATQTDTATDGNTGTVAEFLTVTIGVDEPGRMILVCMTVRSGNQNGRFSSATLGAAAGTLLVESANETGSNLSYAAAIIFAAPPAGTTAVLTVVFTQNISIGTGVCVYNLQGIQSATAKDTDTDANGGAPTMSLSVERGDVAFGVAFARVDTTVDWAAGVDEDVEVLVPGNGDSTFGSRTMTATDASFAVTASMDTNNTNCGCAVVLR